MVNTKWGYCTNIHTGVTIEQVQSNLEQFATPIKNQVSPNAPMGIGLWLANHAATQLIETNRIDSLADWLKMTGLDPFTFNAFPFNNFHQDIVKHQVYEPTWADQERLAYTLNIAEVQSHLIQEGEFGSISTLPLGWSNHKSAPFLQSCANNLIECAVRLAELKQQTGRHIFLCIEPEPGCIFDVSQDVVDFFDQFLTPNDAGKCQLIRNHVGVCHDVCHAAVMREPQATAIENYVKNGIHIGKYQISSALSVNFSVLSASQKSAALDMLQEFGEDRYLHQTVITSDSHREFIEDLPMALQRANRNPRGTWTVHFHVPIFLQDLGALNTTRNEIFEALQNIPSEYDFPLHLEVETYAWTVMPASLKKASLADVVAQELNFLRQLLPTTEN